MVWKYREMISLRTLPVFLFKARRTKPKTHIGASGHTLESLQRWILNESQDWEKKSFLFLHTIS